MINGLFFWVFEPPLFWEAVAFSFLIRFWQLFVSQMCQEEGLKFCFGQQKQWNAHLGSSLPQVLKCSITGQSTLVDLQVTREIVKWLITGSLSFCETSRIQVGNRFYETISLSRWHGKSSTEQADTSTTISWGDLACGFLKYGLMANWKKKALF
jgi:hypothetical protein